MNPLSLLHLLNLDTIGGVEDLFIAFLEHTKNQAHHYVLITGKKPHPFFHQRLYEAAKSVTLQQYLFGMKIPAALRPLRRNYVIDKTAAHTLILWNRIEPLSPLPQGMQKVYYEHGASWMEPADSTCKALFSKMDLLLANSFAARRLMQLKWGIRAPIHVIENPLKPSITARDTPKERDFGRPLRLGYIGRLIPLKGVVLIPHVVHALLKQKIPVECFIAGDGPEKMRLQNISASLGVSDAVHLLGCIQDVTQFYASIDILIVPSIREPLGLVAQEAALCGCPVVAACVDGLPEVVIHEKTGMCLPPTLPLSELASLGGRAAHLPDLVFDPVSDSLVLPKIVDPAYIVSSVRQIIASAESYRAMSEQAILHAKKRPTIARYAQELLDVITTKNLY
jgi:glycosyltransferase involved in cell wall biosynthesis